MLDSSPHGTNAMPLETILSGVVSLQPQHATTHDDDRTPRQPSSVELLITVTTTPLMLECSCRIRLALQIPEQQGKNA